MSPVWLAKPTGDDFADVYPKSALEGGVAGSVTLACQPADDGLLTACRVVAERPPGFGFGQAALSLAPKFRLAPTDRDGTPVAGGEIRLPLRFTP